MSTYLDCMPGVEALLIADPQRDVISLEADRQRVVDACSPSFCPKHLYNASKHETVMASMLDAATYGGRHRSSRSRIPRLSLDVIPAVVDTISAIRSLIGL